MTKDIQQLAQELAVQIKTEKDLNEFSAMLKKLTIEAALNAEMREHLGFDKHQPSPSNNSRNGISKKTEPPRDCRRPIYLREYNHENSQTIFQRNQATCRAFSA